MQDAAVSRDVSVVTPEQERFLTSRVFRSLILNRSSQWRSCINLLLSMHADQYWSSHGAILDIGCGLGTFCNLAARAFPQERVVGVENDLECVYAARAHARGGVLIQQSKGNDNLLDFPSQSFAWVTSMHSLAQVENPRMMVADIARVLTPDGIATFVVSNMFFEVGMLPWDIFFGPKPDSAVKHHWGRRLFQQMLWSQGLHSVSYPFGDKLRLLPGVKSWFIVNAWKEGCYGSICDPGDRLGRGGGGAGRTAIPRIFIR